MFEKLEETNFLLYAAKYYNNPQCFDTTEFYEDLKRFKYIKRLLNKYRKTGDLKERLILNHIIALGNVFGPTPTTRMLFLKLSGMERELKPFLAFLSLMPEKVSGLGPRDDIIYSVDIQDDITITKALREL
jgi:hypothetical protein